MTPVDVLRAVTEAEIGREIIRLVPHWYEAECGPVEYSITIGRRVARFFNYGKLSSNLCQLLSLIGEPSRDLQFERFASTPARPMC